MLIISIHALAKRATYTYQSHGKFLKSFQSTPSQRGRPSPLPANWDWCMNFNPRPRKEGDSFCTLYKISRFISIHALVKRATLNNLRYFQIKTISIHALVKRATRHSSYPPSFEFRDFNPRPRKEGDKLCACCLSCSNYFNPRPRKEGDCNGGRSHR